MFEDPNPDNIISVLISLPEGEEYSDIISKAEAFVVSDPKSFFESQKFLDVTESVLTRILQMDQLGIPEHEIFLHCLEWAQKSKAFSRKIQVVIPYIRFPLMSIEQISTVVIPENVLTKDEALELMQFVSTAGKLGRSRFSVVPRKGPARLYSAPFSLIYIVSSKLEQFRHQNSRISSKIILNSGCHIFPELIISKNGILSCNSWDGKKGGKMYIFAQSVVVEKGGKIDVSGREKAEKKDEKII